MGILRWSPEPLRGLQRALRGSFGALGGFRGGLGGCAGLARSSSHCSASPRASALERAAQRSGRGAWQGRGGARQVQGESKRQVAALTQHLTTPTRVTTRATLELQLSVSLAEPYPVLLQLCELRSILVTERHVYHQSTCSNTHAHCYNHGHGQ